MSRSDNFSSSIPPPPTAFVPAGTSEPPTSSFRPPTSRRRSCKRKEPEQSYPSLNGEPQANARVYNEGRWTRKEQRDFQRAIAMFGNSWPKVSDYIWTRKPSQVRSHNQKMNKRSSKRLRDMNQKAISNFLEDKKELALEGLKKLQTVSDTCRVEIDRSFLEQLTEILVPQTSSSIVLTKEALTYAMCKIFMREFKDLEPAPNAISQPAPSSESIDFPVSPIPEDHMPQPILTEARNAYSDTTAMEASPIIRTSKRYFNAFDDTSSRHGY